MKKNDRKLRRENAKKINYILLHVATERELFVRMLPPFILAALCATLAAIPLCGYITALASLCIGIKGAVPIIKELHHRRRMNKKMRKENNDDTVNRP